MEKARSLLQSYGLRRDNQSVSADNSVLCLICRLSRFCFVLFPVERWGRLVKKREEGALCAEKKSSCSGAERTEADIVELVPRFCSLLP